MAFGKKNISKSSVRARHAISRKKDAFLRKTANKHRVINVMSTELRKDVTGFIHMIMLTLTL